MNGKTLHWCTCLVLLLCVLTVAPPGAGAKDRVAPGITAYNSANDRVLTGGVWKEILYVKNTYEGSTSTGSWEEPYKTIEEALVILNPATHVIFVVRTSKPYGGFAVSKNSATIWGQGYTLPVKPRKGAPSIPLPGFVVVPHGLEGGKFPDVEGLVTVTGSNVEVTGLSFGKGKGDLFTISEGTAVYVHYNTFYATPTPSTGIRVSGGRGATISRNAFVGTGGVTLAGGSETTIYENKFDIKGKGNAAITLAGKTPGLTVGANDIKSQGYGIYADTAVPLGGPPINRRGPNDNLIVLSHNTITVRGTGLGSDVAGISLRSSDCIYAKVDANDMSGGIMGDLNAFGVYLAAESGVVHCDMNEGPINVTSNGGDAAGVFLLGDRLEGNYRGGMGMPTVSGGPDGEAYAVIDAEVVDDLGELNAAIEGGESGWIYIKNGSYSGDLAPVGRGVYLWGEGLDMYGMGSSGRPAFNRTLTVNASNAAVMGLGFSIPDTDDATGIAITGGNGIKILGNKLTGAAVEITYIESRNGISIAGGKSISIGDGKEDHKNIVTIGAWGVYIAGGGTGISINNNHIESTTNYRSAIFLGADVPVSILNNELVSKYFGIYADVDDGLTTGPITHNSITVNPGYGDNGIFLVGHGTLNTIISSNTIKCKDDNGTGHGIYCRFTDIGTAGERATIEGNTIAVNGTYNIYGIELDGSRGIYADIIGNTITACATTGTCRSYGIYVSTEGNISITSSDNLLMISSLRDDAYGFDVFANLDITGSINDNKNMLVEAKHDSPNGSGDYTAYGVYVKTTTVHGTIGTPDNPLHIDNNSGEINGDGERYGIYLKSASPGGGNSVVWDGTSFTSEADFSGNYGEGRVWHNFVIPSDSISP
jgi:hypothetical protein